MDVAALLPKMVKLIELCLPHHEREQALQEALRKAETRLEAK